MMERITINPGTVDWSGENPGMYLKESQEGPFVSLISFFRVYFSPHGRGHAAFLFLDPHGDGRSPGKPNLCATDNPTLAEYLRSSFLGHFMAFRGVPAVASCRVARGWDFTASGDPRSSYTERFRTQEGNVTLVWEGLTEAFMVELPKEKSATGLHEMFSLFVTASGVNASVHGSDVAGRPVPRDMAGKMTSTAFLAFSETWVRR
jgi:hypothetical protein